MFSGPPRRSIKPFAIFDGKNPGAMLLTRMCLGPSSTARLRVKCIAAAFEAEYPKVAFSPSEPVPSPATEPVTITREHDSRVALFSRSGANLHVISGHIERATGVPYFCTVTKILLTLRSITLENALSGCVSNFSPQVAPAFASRMST